MEKFIIANNTALRISDSGRNEQVVVLLHGYLESLEIWDRFAKGLEREYRVVAIDIPGMGISEVKGDVHTMEFLADVLHDVLVKQGIVSCFVVGHSMGGYVAEAFAAKYPQMLKGLVLFHSTPNPDSAEKIADREREIELVKGDKKELVANLFAPKGFAESNRKRLREVIDQLHEMIILSDDQGVIAILRGLILRVDQNEMLRNLKTPQLFIFGRKDEFIPVEVAETIIAAQPQAEAAWLENSAHMGFVEEEAASLEILKNFLSKHT